jgi:hypothetical protein
MRGMHAMLKLATTVFDQIVVQGMVHSELRNRRQNSVGRLREELLLSPSYTI